MATPSSTTPKRDAEWVVQRLKLHHRFRLVSSLAVIILGSLVAGGWLLFRNHIGDRQFDGKRFTVAEVIDGGSFVIADGPRTRVALLGVDAPQWPDAHYSKESASYLTGRLKEKVVLLKLDGVRGSEAPLA